MAPKYKAYSLGPFWLGYTFLASEEEARFKERFREVLRPIINAWCGYHLLYAVALALQEVATGDLTTTLLPLCPIALTCATLFFFNFDWGSKRVRRSAEWVLTSMCLLLTAYAIAMLFIKAEDMYTDVLENQLADVVKQLNVSRQQQLLDVLKSYIRRKETEATMLQTVGFSTIQVALLAYIGFTWALGGGIVLMTVMMVAAFLADPFVSKLAVFIEILIPAILSSAYFMYLSLSIARQQRRRFAVEQTFETDFNDAVAAAQEADTILNHTLKNTMADASGEIEIFLSQTEQQDSHLVRSMECLRRGMRSCQHRQAYLELSAKKYHPLFTAVRLDEFAMELTAGRQLQKVDTHPSVVMMDRVLCSLILDNAISNSFKHGHPDDPAVDFVTAVNPLPPDVRLPTNASGVAVTFTITNRANPHRPPITPTFLAHMLQGQAPRQEEGRSMLSSRVGLQHSALAAQAHGIKWQLCQSGDVVTFKATMSVKLASKTPVEGPLRSPSSDCETFLQGLTVLCIDDSAAARRLLAYHLSRHLPSARVLCYGESSTDVGPFMDGIIAGADVAILDEHLDFQNGAMVLGSDLIRQCRASLYSGVMCIRSANVSPAEMARYRAAGADLVIGKDVPVPKMIEQLKAEVIRRSALALAVTAMGPTLPGTFSASLIDLNPGTSIATSPCHSL
eukprot:EG_transcript_1668